MLNLDITHTIRITYSKLIANTLNMDFSNDVTGSGGEMKGVWGTRQLRKCCRFCVRSCQKCKLT